jgi:hypothetical protein
MAGLDTLYNIKDNRFNIKRGNSRKKQEARNKLCVQGNERYGRLKFFSQRLRDHRSHRELGIVLVSEPHAVAPQLRVGNNGGFNPAPPRFEVIPDDLHVHRVVIHDEDNRTAVEALPGQAWRPGRGRGQEGRGETQGDQQGLRRAHAPGATRGMSPGIVFILFA